MLLMRRIPRRPRRRRAQASSRQPCATWACTASCTAGTARRTPRRWHGPLLAGARSCHRLLRASASLGQSTAQAALSPAIASLVCDTGSADKTPKVLLLLDGKEAELPDWYTSVAMSFKEGKKKSVSFAVVKEDGEKAALRFGVQKDEAVPKAGILIVAVVDGKGAGRYARFTGSELRAGGGAAVRAVKVRV